MPVANDSKIFADFLCTIADKSDRPELALKSNMATLTAYYKGLGHNDPIHNEDLLSLYAALVKATTSLPACQTPVMPIKPLYDI